MDDRKIIFSGVQPSGMITLGNYLGAIKNWVTLQDDYQCLYAIMDLHSITVRQDPKVLRKNSIDLFKMYIACGLDPEKNLIFFQSHVPQHSQLAWALNCYTYMGELSRMTQFKDKSARHADNINAGLFTYPVLMAADILLYQTDLVPIGLDQKQHLELARNVAERFNGVYGNVFKVPEPYIAKTGAKITSLQEPTKKMSKSDANAKAYISMLDTADQAAKKINSAGTDSEGIVAYREGKDGINNLMGILSTITGESFESIENRFAGRGYGDFKAEVAEAVAECMRPIHEKFNDLSNNNDYIESIYKKSAERAGAMAERTLKKVYKKLGFIAG